MKIFLLCVGVLALLTVLILLCPLKIRIISDGELRLKLSVGAVSVQVYPKREKKKRLPGLSHKKYMKLMELERQKRSRGAAGAAKKRATEGETDGIGSVSEALELAKEVLGAARRASRHMRTDIKLCRITVGGEDAAATAVKHGAIAALLRAFFELARDVGELRMKDENVALVCDYTADGVDIKLDMTVRLRVCYALRETARAIIKLQDRGTVINKANERKVYHDGRK